MPDPLLYLQALGAAMVSSGIFVLLMVRRGSRVSRISPNLSSTLGMALGVAAGLLVLRLRVAWPPANGLDRFLAIILPTALVIEMAAEIPRLSRWLAPTLRIALVATSGRILMHGSVYLRADRGDWTTWKLVVVLTLSAAALAFVWALLSRLLNRSADAAIPLSIAMATQCAGVLVMLAGYLKGGTAAFPLAAALVGSAVASLRIRPGADLRGIVGLGVVGLFGVLFIGRFFGGLTTGASVVVLMAPLLCWASELPRLRQQHPWRKFLFRLVLVGIPLLIVLVLAKRDFDRDMSPLLLRSKPNP